MTPGQQEESGERRDFFVSYAGADRPWALWAASLLEAEQYSVELDVWDWPIGADLVRAMNTALLRADRLLLLLSPAYFDHARYTREEWSAGVVLAHLDEGKLVPVVVEHVDLRKTAPLLASRIHVNLVGLPEEQAERVLLERLQGLTGRGQQHAYPGPPDTSTKGVHGSTGNRTRAVYVTVSAVGILIALVGAAIVISREERGPQGDCYPVTGDWDGNGSETLGVACGHNRSLRWWLTNSIANARTNYSPFVFGDADDCLPVTGDWDGDGYDTVGVACATPKSAEITWHLTDQLREQSPSHPPFVFGNAALCRPVTGEWQDGGRTGIGVACKKNSQDMSWSLTSRPTGTSETLEVYGNTSQCLPVVGDWDGDGRTSLGNACRKPDSGLIAWSLVDDLAGSPGFDRFRFGAIKNCRPVAGDWNGTGITAVGVACNVGGEIQWELMPSVPTDQRVVRSRYGTTSGTAWSLPILGGAPWPSWPK